LQLAKHSRTKWTTHDGDCISSSSVTALYVLCDRSSCHFSRCTNAMQAIIIPRGTWRCDVAWTNVLLRLTQERTWIDLRSSVGRSALSPRACIQSMTEVLSWIFRVFRQVRGILRLLYFLAVTSGVPVNTHTAATHLFFVLNCKGSATFGVLKGIFPTRELVRKAALPTVTRPTTRGTNRAITPPEAFKNMFSC